jgi:hypothetical protein
VTPPKRANGVVFFFFLELCEARFDQALLFDLPLAQD